MDDLEGVEARFLKIDQLQAMIHAFAKRAYSYQLTYVKRIDEKKMQMAKDENLSEIIQQKYVKNQEKILKNIREKSTSRMDERGFGGSDGKSLKADSDKVKLERDPSNSNLKEDQKNETLSMQQRQTSQKPGCS